MAEIRRLGKSDIEAWLDLRLALWPGNSRPEFTAEIDTMLARGDVEPAFGVFTDGAMVGLGEAAEREWGNGCLTSPVAWLEGIYVLPAHRRHGYAALLVQAVTAWARTRDLSELGSDVQVEDTVSLLGHANWGFVETERLVVLRKDI